MTPRRQTLRGIVIALTVALASGLIALGVEFHAIAAGGNSTISEIVWSAWAAQPGAFVAVLLPLAFAAGFLAGHFFWQARAVYDAERGRVNIDLAIQAVQQMRALGVHHLDRACITSRPAVAQQIVDADFLVELVRDMRA